MLLVQVCHISLSLFTPDTLPIFLVKNIVKLKSPTLSLYKHSPQNLPTGPNRLPIKPLVRAHTGILERDPSYGRCR